MINLAIAIGLWVGLSGGLKLQGSAVAAGRISNSANRKLAHIALGAIFLFSWLLYQDEPAARWWAALPAVGFALQFVLLGAGVIQDSQVVGSATRRGHPREILQGPFTYLAAVALLTVLFWRHSPIGIAAVAIMSFGDGFAEIVGRKFSSPALPWNRDKSVAGSAAMLLTGWAGAAAALWVFAARGYLPGPWEGYLTPLMAVAVAGTVIESLSVGEVDNLTVSLGCAAVGFLLF